MANSGTNTNSAMLSESFLDEFPVLMTIKEVRSVLRICNPLIYQMINNGVLPATIVGNRYLVPKQAVKEYLFHNTKQPGMLIRTAPRSKKRLDG